MKTKIQIILKITILTLLSLTINSSASTTFYNLAGERTNNEGTQNYTIYGETVKSYLYENEDKTVTRLEYLQNENKILIETYDKTYTLKSTKKLSCSLPLFGGFHSGKQYNFIVLGQLNITEDKTIPVYRIEKYSKSWQKLETVELKNCNTRAPFSSGSCRMAEENGTLYIETCHTMYKSSDGFCHQANLGIELDIENMQIEYARTGVTYIGTGYVTHSFNQFIQVENGYSYTVNHGDAYPRSIVLIKRSTGGIWVRAYADILEIPGTIGDNNTGTSIGGFELSTNNCIVAGNSIFKNTNILNKKAKRNIFISLTPKENIKEEKTKTIWLTNYVDEEPITPSTPHLVKISNNRFVVLWEEYDKSTRVKAALIDENGAQIGRIISIKAKLSDCKPIVHDNNLIWYTSDETKTTMFLLDISSDTAFIKNEEEADEETTNALLGDANDDRKIDTKDARLALLCYVGKINLKAETKSLLDVNQDGKVDHKDARQILLYYVGKTKNLK